MLIGNIVQVDRRVRLFDVDNSFIDIDIESALYVYEWVAKHRYRLLEELRVQDEARRKKVEEHE